MSRNALALVDCSSRDKLFHYLINTFDRKSTKKEMISPYDDQLIGKMNFRHNGMEHAMFFTYARSSEYPGMKFRNHKVIYLSLDVNDTSADIFNRICTRFGGYVIYNDDIETDWQKVERQQTDNDDDLSLSEEIVAERSFLFDVEEDGQEKKVYRELKLEPDVEEEAEEREWAPPVTEVKSDKKAEHKKHEKKQEHKADKMENRTENREKRESGRNGKGHRNGRAEIQIALDDKEEHRTESKAEQKAAPKITVRETLRSHERQKEQKEQRELKKASQKENKKDMQKEQLKQDSPRNENGKNNAGENGNENRKPYHHRGHRGGRKHTNKSAGKEQNLYNGQNGNENHKPQTQKTDA